MCQTLAVVPRITYSLESLQEDNPTEVAFLKPEKTVLGQRIFRVLHRSDPFAVTVTILQLNSLT